ncbi:MAG: hypothetical protein HC875_29375, partial [Anaerolineales bacterium]|nr:hypothetical protein [Anaerolineales bacterium]
ARVGTFLFLESSVTGRPNELRHADNTPIAKGVQLSFNSGETYYIIDFDSIPDELRRADTDALLDTLQGEFTSKWSVSENFPFLS